MTIQEILEQAVCAKRSASLLSTQEKNELLKAMANAILESEDEILTANRKDCEKAKETIRPTMLDRLTLTSERIKEMAKGVLALIDLQDPVGQELSQIERPNGLKIHKIRVPMGVVAIIYESRPNVTSDAAALCVKSGNVCVLRGGKEALHSNKAIVHAMQKALVQCGLPKAMISFIDDPSRESAKELMQARGKVDLLIPRGGKSLIEACVKQATVPCIETGTGICHIYVDADADLQMALDIVDNAKTSRPSVCNAAEVCLIHKEVASAFLPLLEKRMKEKNTQLRLCSRSNQIIQGVQASAEDFDTEFLEYILAVKIVDSLQDAVEHIAQHSTHHSEAIITNNQQAAHLFVKMVESAAVYINASTRFTDGGEFGLGCEMGISTQKLGARGPMGLCELTTYQYMIEGNGQIR